MDARVPLESRRQPAPIVAQVEHRFSPPPLLAAFVTSF